MDKFINKISIKSSIQNAILPACRTHHFPQHRIIADWAEIVGLELARITVPIKLITPKYIADRSEDFDAIDPIAKKRRQPKAVLVCGISNPAFALRLQMSEQLILERINLYFGYKAIYQIQLRTAEFAFVKQTNSSILHKKQTISQQKMDNIQNNIEKITDLDLKQLLEEILQGSFIIAT